jgi:hypothetical protein
MASNEFSVPLFRAEREAYDCEAKRRMVEGVAIP